MRRLALAVLFLAAASFGQEVGNVSALVPASSITRAQKTATAKVADPVWLNDVLRTDKAGRMRLKLEDGSRLTVGSAAELRVVKHDPNSQQSDIELLYGAIRGQVRSVTKKGGFFTIRTPTAAIGVIGTTVGVDSETTSPINVISDDQLAQLPTGRDFNSLAQLTPGSGRQISDYGNASQTTVWSEDHLVFVRNIDPAVQGSVVLMPWEYTVVKRGQPPLPPQRMTTPYSQAYNEKVAHDQAANMAREIGYVGSGQSYCQLFDAAHHRTLGLPSSAGGQPPFDPEKISVQVHGGGTSTGNSVFHVHVENHSDQCVRLIVPAGAILKPTGFWERKLVGALLGGNPDIKNFQIMIAEGGSWELALPSDQVTTPGGGEIPAGGALDFELRGFCLELHKLAPHPSTKYEFAGNDEVEHFDPNRRLLGRVYQMFYSGQLQSQYHPLDAIAQWTLWASREKLDAKKFKEEFVALVHKNFDSQKKKWDKAAQHEAEAWADDLWTQADKVLAADKAGEAAHPH